LLVRAREWERDRFWVLPSLLVLAGGRAGRADR
jgi:hypothetical protein